jgi:hypothetical protein
MDLQAVRPDLRFHRLDLVRPCIGLHNDDHDSSPGKKSGGPWAARSLLKFL